MSGRDKRVTQEFYEDEAYRLSGPATIKLGNAFAAHLRSCTSLPGIERILDLGCGSADYVQALPDSGTEYIGVDFCRGMLGKAVQFNSDRKATFFVRTDIECLPVPSGCVDLVYSVGVLGEYAPVDRAMREAARVLRSGGVFTFTFMDLLTPYRVWKTAKIAAMRLVFGTDALAYRRVGGGMIARYPTTATYVRATAKRAGFRDIILQKMQDERAHCLVTCMKR